MELTIVHLSQDFRQDKAQLGAFSRMYNLMKDGNKHVVFTIHFGDEECSSFKIDDIDIISVGIGTRKLSLRNEWTLTKFLSKKILDFIKINKVNPDILVGHAQLLNYKILLKLKKKLKVPFIWDANTIWGLPLFTDGFLFYKFYYYLFALLNYKKCDRLIAQTYKCKEILQKTYKLPTEKINIVTNSVDITKSIKRKNYSLRDPSKPLEVFVVGRFDKLNGLDFIINNINIFDPKKFKLNLVGDGGYINEINKLHTRKMLTYHGTVPYSQMEKIYKQADVLLIPREDCFGSNNFIPTKLLEGMAYGLIVLGSTVGGVTEVINHGENGYLFKNNNGDDLLGKLKFIGSLTIESMERIGFNAINTIEKDYSLEKNLLKLNFIYQSLINN